MTIFPNHDRQEVASRGWHGQALLVREQSSDRKGAEFLSALESGKITVRHPQGVTLQEVVILGAMPMLARE